MIGIEIWSDGASSGPQKRGGWAAVLIYPGSKLSISGYEEKSTSNRMELTGIVRGLEAIGDTRAAVDVYTDSSYARNPFTRGWVKKWQENGWKTYDGSNVANRDLWEHLIVLVAQHKVRWHKIRGHSTWELNNEADALAVRAKLSGQGVTLFS